MATKAKQIEQQALERAEADTAALIKGLLDAVDEFGVDDPDYPGMGVKLVKGTEWDKWRSAQAERARQSIDRIHGACEAIQLEKERDAMGKFPTACLHTE